MSRTKRLTAVQQSLGAGAAGAVEPLISPFISASTGLSFEGVGQVGGYYSTPEGIFRPSVSGQVVVPPDTNAAVGATQVVQWVNTCYAVFDKASGALIAGPFAGTNFWKGFGGPCEANNGGDPIIQWDKKNHRWLAAQNVFSGPPFYTCVAVSQTADATHNIIRSIAGATTRAWLSMARTRARSGTRTSTTPWTARSPGTRGSLRSSSRMRHDERRERRNS
jgi:hypothetical protein